MMNLIINRKQDKYKNLLKTAEEVVKKEDKKETYIV